MPAPVFARVLEGFSSASQPLRDPARNRYVQMI
jgi:hypothetical protein